MSTPFGTLLRLYLDQAGLSLNALGVRALGTRDLRRAAGMSMRPGGAASYLSKVTSGKVAIGGINPRIVPHLAHTLGLAPVSTQLFTDLAALTHLPSWADHAKFLRLVMSSYLDEPALRSALLRDSVVQQLIAAIAASPPGRAEPLPAQPTAPAAARPRRRGRTGTG